uniref:Uncharacterized protein n=1 Tax=Spongospora subterranea TaxID=70186 RepID=A0A0H5QXV6_9EUKA|eukprot:CRZ06793.1 hypothetical protein [Spongospora subterranea]
MFVLALTYCVLNSIAALFSASFLFVICVSFVLKRIAVSNLSLNLLLKLRAVFKCLFQNLHLVTLTYRYFMLCCSIAVNLDSLIVGLVGFRWLSLVPSPLICGQVF